VEALEGLNALRQGNKIPIKTNGVFKLNICGTN
jgi:hypothetical protein